MNNRRGSMFSRGNRRESMYLKSINEPNIKSLNRMMPLKESPSQILDSSLEMYSDSPMDPNEPIDRIRKLSRDNCEFNPEKILAEVKYQRLQSVFERADKDGESGLSIDEFQDAIKKTVGDNLSRTEIQMLFMKVDANCDGVVDWEEYVTYNLLEYQEKTQMLEMMRERPFPQETQDVPSRHRDTIVQVLFFPSIQKRGPVGDKIDYNSGRYVSLSKEGVVIFWNLKMKKIRSYLTHAHVERMTQPWLTNMVCMYNVNSLAVTSTDRDIIVFDLQGNKFVKRYHVTGIEDCVTAMNYWADLSDLNRAVMLWGDTAGDIFVLKFEQSLRGGPFGPLSGKDVFKKVSLPEVIRGFFIGVKGYKIGKIHEDWVSQIMYVPIMDCLMSCCQSSSTSLYLCDFEKKKLSSTIKVSKGILSFDFCPNNNIIVTGGMDHLVRVWNPYVNNKAIAIMKGHTKPITDIIINSLKNQIISIDKGRNIRVFDLKDQKCIQQLSGRVVKLGPFSISAICFNPITQMLVLATNQLAILEKHVEEENKIEMISHNKPIMRALHNKTFNFIISVCQDSVVSVWDVRTGEKVIQFINAHKRLERGVEVPVEISAMSLDGPERRLLTGARNGSVKVWNFNNGACLQTFQLPDGLDVTGISCTRNRIYVTGWDRLVHVFVDGEGQEFRKQWKPKHNEDILCMECLSSNILATGSYDGDIVVWSRETGQAYCTLNAFKGTKPVTDNTNKMEKSDETEDDRRSSTLLENFTPSEDSVDKNKAKKPQVKSFRVGVGILQKVRDIQNADHKSSQENTRIDTPCEHPLLSALEMKSQEEVYLANETTTSRRCYDDICKVYEASVEKILFLEKRDNLCKDTAIVVTSGAEGWVRAWSIHHQGGLLGQFNAAHKIGEGVHALATDEDNNYIITADTCGYVKVWDITEYCIQVRHTNAARRARWEYLIEKFPYLKFESNFRSEPPRSFTSRKNKPEDIWKRPPPATSLPKRTMKWPLLVNSFRAHTKVINSVAYVDSLGLMCTGSVDCSIRLWTIGGQYVGTFGETWNEISPETVLRCKRARVPRDLRRTGSARTLKVLNSGEIPLWQTAFETMKKRGLNRPENQVEKNVASEDKNQGTDTSIDKTEKKLEKSEILGKAYKRKVRHKIPPILPKLIETPNSIAVYHSLPFVELSPVEHLYPKDLMAAMKYRRYGAAVRDKLKGLGKKKEQQTALVVVYNKVTNKATNKVHAPALKHKLKPSRIKKIYNNMQGKGCEIEPDPPKAVTISDPEVSVEVTTTDSRQLRVDSSQASNTSELCI